ncbi:hypothetical protein [Arsukibacterium sp. UBA3155]|uniref:hypothetical protein n=1 Tax=Arsukibacterium sp. UBA3155 TaxID=1946058 RepID=UPI0025C3231F|nr:hypothetical protein [Arsukibacterium sp. UBA3155]
MSFSNVISVFEFNVRYFKNLLVKKIELEKFLKICHFQTAFSAFLPPIAILPVAASSVWFVVGQNWGSTKTASVRNCPTATVETPASKGQGRTAKQRQRVRIHL